MRPLYGAYVLAKVPLAALAGLRIRQIDAERCSVSVPYGWMTTNPFRSTYFAALSMAAEMSTGALALVAARSCPRPISTLIVGMDGKFEKKATTATTFTCAAGPQIAAAIDETLTTGEPVAVDVDSVGTAEDGAVVARFCFRWSFKRKGG